MSNLISHKDTSIVSEAVVLAEPRPDFTSTFRPYSHKEVLGAVGRACDKLGWEVARKQYAIRPGSKMFGVWDLERKGGQIVRTEERTLTVGIRNGIDRTMSVGLCAGLRVFVCDNLAFTGDVVMFRKHTGGLELDEIDIMAEEALVALEARFERTEAWVDGMKQIPLTTGQATTLAVAAMARQYPLIPPKKYPLFHDLYFERDRYTPTLNGFHGAITEMFQETALIDVLWRTGLLVDFINHEVPILLNGSGRTVFQPGKLPFKIVQDEARELKAEARAGRKAEARAAVSEVKDRVQARLKESRKKVDPPQIDDSAIADPFGPGTSQEEPKAKGKGKGKGKPKKAAQGPQVKAEKKPRRTARVKIRELMAAEKKAGRKMNVIQVPGIGPVGFTAVEEPKKKKHKAEKVLTGKAAERALKKATAKDEEGDLYFCEDCRGEFLRKDIKVVGTEYVCSGCLEGRGKKKRAK